MKALPVIALFLLAGCWKGMQKAPAIGDRAGRGTTPTGTSSTGPTLSQKTVTGKEDTSTIVAFDGSKCVVTEARFRETVIGEKAWCVWSEPKPR